MHAAGAHVALAGPVRPRVEVADVVRRFGDELRSSRTLSLEQRRALTAIASCRTARLGGHVDVCPDCGLQQPAYNSCRNRHCPKCQWLASQRWLDRRLQRMLPVHHFHVVFTLPSELRPLALYNRALLFDLLFQSASDALKKLAEDDRRLGAQLGITAVLHTWSRDLGFHPHIHCVVTGGGLGRDGNWVRTRPNFLFPVRVLGKLFRGIFLYRLRRLYADGTLACTGKLSALARAPEFQRLLDKLFRKRWNVYSKKPFGGVQGVHQYLAKYTHRIAISNRRLIGFDDRAVVFYTRGGKTASLGPLAFLARFLSHVLPHGFVRIRHFGLYASGSVNTRLPRARASLLAEHANDSGATPVDETLADKTLAGKTLADTTVARLPADQHGQTPDGPDHAKPYLVATGVDLRRCAACGGVMVRYRLFPDVMGSLALGSPATAWSISATRAPPEAA